MAVSWQEVAELLAREGAEIAGRGAPLTGMVDRVECRPQEARPGDLFCVFPEFHGYQQWWEIDSILTAIEARSPALVVGPPEMPALVCPHVRVAHPAVTGARLAAAHAGDLKGLPIFGVTGTNGKTTTVKLLAHLWERICGPGADLGTLGTFFRSAAFASGEYTTDLAVVLHPKLAALRASGATGVAMEVSSHALALERVAGVDFAAGVLTNVTRDHLEFHGDEVAYRAAKQRLFAGLRPEALAVLNMDDPHAAEFAAATSARVLGYGEQPWADLRLLEADFGVAGTRFVVEWQGRRSEAHTALVGAFQLHNVLAAAATLLGYGVEADAIWAALPDFHAVCGRMERIGLPNGAAAVIDYAHNPDGLEQVLRSCRAMRPRRLLVVFGCGGDRDRGKRPLMGGLAETWADAGWITSDNPRTEDPAEIVVEIIAGLKDPGAFPVALDRAEAIRAALDASEAGDVVLIAGKGHEDYQIIGTEKRPFSDHAVVRAWAVEQPTS